MELKYPAKLVSVSDSPNLLIVLNGIEMSLTEAFDLICSFF